MRRLVLAPVSLVLFLFIAGPAVAEEAGLIAGCLTSNGSLVKLAPGATPNRPCTNQQVRLSFGVSKLSNTNAERLSLGDTRFPVDGVGDRAAAVLRLHFSF